MTPYTAFAARWIAPVAEPPLADACLVVQDGRVVEVTRQRPAHIDHDFGRCLIVPGFVNAHTHLDLTGLAGLAPPRPDFVGWLGDVIRFRRTRTPEQVAGDVRAGIRQSLRAGVTLVGDIASFDTAPLLTASPLRAVVFRELLGLSNERAAALLPPFPPGSTGGEGMGVRGDTSGGELSRSSDDKSSSQRKRIPPHPHPLSPRTAGGRGVKEALSPHAPYSVHRDLFAWALGQPLPVAVHLAESLAERELIESHTGPMVAFLQALGVWNPDGLIPSWGWLLAQAAPAPRLWIHANYLPPQPLPAHHSIVYCPRTHAAFGHPPHPFRDFLALGVNVAIGTDGLASNPDLSVLEELRFLHRIYPDLPADILLNLGTRAGAVALGQFDCGWLAPGSQADFAVHRLATDDPLSNLFGATYPVQSSYLAGRSITYD